MPHTDANPASASVATTGKGIKYISGRYWAGWSGQVITNNSTETAFEFNSPDTPLKALISWATDFGQMGSGHEYRLIIELNEQIVWRFGTKNEAARGQSDWDPIHLVIPPFSTFKLTVFCETTTDIKWTLNITAREL